MGKRVQQPERTANQTGIPVQMKLDYERRGGVPLDDVRVHYNSDKPGRLGALAYTYGNQVFMGPGQSRHLGHELGHVIQQKLGLVKPTGQVGGLPLNDSPQLEREADAGVWAAPGGGADREVQRLKVSASVFKTGEQGTMCKADQVAVRRLIIAERADTGLKNGSTPVQGDHTIADAFIKQYQEALVVNQGLDKVYLAYIRLFDEVMEDDQMLPVDFIPIDPTEEKVYRMQMKRVENSYLAANMGAELCRRHLKELNDGVLKSLTLHQEELEEVVTFYNEAYAKSLFSTFGIGSSGNRGEHGVGIDAFRGGIDWGKVGSLLDPAAVKAIAASLARILQSNQIKTPKAVIAFAIQKRLFMRLASMVEQMGTYADFGRMNIDAMLNPGVTMEAFRQSSQYMEPEIYEFLMGKKIPYYYGSKTRYWGAGLVPAEYSLREKLEKEGKIPKRMEKENEESAEEVVDYSWLYDDKSSDSPPIRTQKRMLGD